MVLREGADTLRGSIKRKEQKALLTLSPFNLFLSHLKHAHGALKALTPIREQSWDDSVAYLYKADSPLSLSKTL